MTAFFYAISGMTALTAGLYFATRQGNGLKIKLVCFFSALAWYQFNWAINIIATDCVIEANTMHWYASNVPFIVANIWLVGYILKVWGE